MTIPEYVENIRKRHATGISREHAYRGDLQQLLESLLDDVLVTNEPARIKCGSPDYVLTRKEIPIGYIEAKDIGIDLGKTLKSEQIKRYTKSLDNLILTDYIHFIFIKEGKETTRIELFDLNDNLFSQTKDPEKTYNEFEALIIGFAQEVSQSIRSPRRLSEMMANKAKLLAGVIEKALLSDEENKANTSLKQQMDAFKKILIHDITPKQFADIYAQTITYGMFAARHKDTTLDDFSRQEAASLIPKSNPFLRKLFQYISGYDIDSRIEWIVADLAEIFRATDIKKLLNNYGKSTEMNDPIVHFYEDFLADYDPKLRKARGVWYTPAPVVDFIVRAVDEILKSQFGLKMGLADNSKTKIKVQVPTHDKRFKSKMRDHDMEVHKVQILDPATGTGTFLAHTIKHIHSQYFKSMPGAWDSYVDNDLIPRLNGFELLMASYAMAHLKMDLVLEETGYSKELDQRFKIYLTNSLEESHPDTGTLFASWLSNEAAEANHIKRDTPVMCILGNPPYSGSSANKGEWIMKLMEDYKKEPGGNFKLKERNPKWINDDYVKFIRYGQHFIEKNSIGVLAFINPHGYLDNPTFRGVRWNLLQTFDKIYTIDLHGNSKKNEISPDGSPDVNVFDIMQGVSINIFIKTGNKKKNELGDFFHFDLFGKRELKYEFLKNNNFSSIPYKKLPNRAPNYFMIPKDFELEDKYVKGFSINDLFILQSMGVTTGNDSQFIGYSNVDLLNTFGKSDIQKIDYRVFDTRYINYDKSKLARARFAFMQNLTTENYSISLVRRSRNSRFVTPYIARNIVDKCIVSTLDNANIFPLYQYPNSNGQQVLENYAERIPNLKQEVIGKISKSIKLEFTNEKNERVNTFCPIDILDYIYAVLHSNKYIEKYHEFLKIDFPRVPYPKDKRTFWRLVELGKQIRQIHLFESPKVNEYITHYPFNGDNIITRKITKTSPGFVADDELLGKVYINETQYFDRVPLVAWDFYIGGYQPARKWLKDRKGRKLSFEDILHYQKIIVALSETDRLMKEIDKVGVV